MENVTIRQKTVVEQLMKEIRSLIANGEYRHNDKIPTEIELAERYGVSRSSVREAIKTLSYLGILESHTSRGTRISKKNRIAEEAASWSVLLGYEKMNEVFVLGTALDTQVSIIIINNLKNKVHSYTGVKKEISATIKKMYKYAKENAIDKYISEFSQYFRILYKASYNTVFISLNECIDSLIVNKVCKAYYETGNLYNATKYLDEILGSIVEQSLEKNLKAVQEYGKFAYDCFTACYKMKEDNDD